jgi:hypothetical protein
MDRRAVDSRELVKRLWRDAAADDLLQREGGLPDLPPSDHVQHREELSELNRGYLFEEPTEPAMPEGGGFRGALKRRVIRLAAEVVRAMLARYFADEREFLLPLVRFQNDLAKKADRLEDELRSVTEATRSELRSLAERIEALHALAEARIERLEEQARG